MAQNSKKERILEAYQHLYDTGKIHSVTQLAETMGRARTGVSKAMAGNPSYLNDKFIMSLINAFPGEFSMEYLINGDGELLAHKCGTNNNECDKNTTQPHSEDGSLEMFNMVLAAKEETIEALRQQLALKDEIIQAKDQLIASLRHQIPYSTIDEPCRMAAEP